MASNSYLPISNDATMSPLAYFPRQRRPRSFAVSVVAYLTMLSILAALLSAVLDLVSPHHRTALANTKNSLAPDGQIEQPTLPHVINADQKPVSIVGEASSSITAPAAKTENTNVVTMALDVTEKVDADKIVVNSVGVKTVTKEATPAPPVGDGDFAEVTHVTTESSIQETTTKAAVAPEGTHSVQTKAIDGSKAASTTASVKKLVSSADAGQTERSTMSVKSADSEPLTHVRTAAEQTAIQEESSSRTSTSMPKADMVALSAEEAAIISNVRAGRPPLSGFAAVAEPATKPVTNAHASSNVNNVQSDNERMLEGGVAAERMAALAVEERLAQMAAFQAPFVRPHY